MNQSCTQRFGIYMGEDTQHIVVNSHELVTHVIAARLVGVG